MPQTQQKPWWLSWPGDRSVIWVRLLGVFMAPPVDGLDRGSLLVPLLVRSDPVPNYGRRSAQLITWIRLAGQSPAGWSWQKTVRLPVMPCG
jgi:hypothetical protein